MQKDINRAELNSFLKKCSYNQQDEQYIMENFYKNDYTCIVRQIYASLNMLNNNKNEYLLFYNLLKKYFSLDCNILDVCCGHIPILSNYIRNEQIHIGKGTVTSVDINLVTNAYGKINKLYKAPFDHKMIKSHDLIVSQAPCDKFDEIVGTSLEYNKAFFVSVCNCNNKIDYFPDNRDPYDEYDFDPVLAMIYSYVKEIERNLKLQYEKIDYDTQDGIRYIYGIPKKKILK